MSKAATTIVGGIAGGLGVAALMTNPAGWAIAAGVAGGALLGNMLTQDIKIPEVSGLGSEPSQTTARSSSEPVHYILGKTSTGGVFDFVEEQQGEQTTGEKLTIVYVLSQGSLDAVEQIYINEEPIENFGDLISYEIVTNPTTVNAYLLANCSGWKDTMIGKGMTWVRVTYTYDAEKFGSGVPSFRPVVRGINSVYDPRTETTGYSDNPVLHELWLLTTLKKVPLDEINLPSFIAAANICDEIVTNPDGSVSKRYTSHCVIGDNESRIAVEQKILSACAGQVNVIGGLHFIQVGVYYGPYDFTVDEDMIIGTVQLQTEVSNADAINTITGTFRDPLQMYQDSDFPQAQNTTWVSDDGGESAEDLRLDYVTDVYQAQRLAWIALKRRRTAGMINTTLNFKGGYNCRPGRVVRINLPFYGIDGEYIVSQWNFNMQDGCNVLFKAYNADIFDDAVGVNYDPLPALTMPSGGIGSPTGLTWTPYTKAEVNQGILSWSAPANSAGKVEYYSVTIRDSAENTVQNYQVVGTSTSCMINGLNAGSYTMGVYSKSALAKSGEAVISVDINTPAIPQVVTYSNTIDSITVIPSNPTTDINGGTYAYYFALSAVSNPLVDAIRLGTGLSFTKQNLAFNTIYHFYIRSENAYGNSGFYHLEASTSNDVSALLSALTNQITSSQLAEDLQSAIENLPNIVNDITGLQGDVTGLEDNVSTLQGMIDELLGAPEYDVNETSVDAGEIRIYEGHLYQADVNMTSPIPVPADTDYWTDLGEFTSIQEQLNEVSSQIVTLTGIVDGAARKTYALNSQYRSDDGSSELETLVANLRSNARFVEEVQVRANADEALAQRLTTAEASVDSLGSSLTELEQVVADNQSSTATALKALESQIDSAESNIAANAGAISTLKTNVRNIDDELESTATALTALESTVTNPETGLSSKASAEDLTEVSTTLDSVQAQRTLKVSAQDSQGRYVLAGIALSADGTVSQSKIYMLADEIAILNEEDGTATTPFIVSGGNVYINSAFINQLTANTITATSLIRSSDGKMVLDFTNKTIRITV